MKISIVLLTSLILTACSKKSSEPAPVPLPTQEKPALAATTPPSVTPTEPSATAVDSCADTASLDGVAGIAWRLQPGFTRTLTCAPGMFGKKPGYALLALDRTDEALVSHLGAFVAMSPTSLALMTVDEGGGMAASETSMTLSVVDLMGDGDAELLVQDISTNHGTAEQVLGYNVGSGSFTKLGSVPVSIDDTAMNPDTGTDCPGTFTTTATSATIELTGRSGEGVVDCLPAIGSYQLVIEDGKLTARAT